MDRTSRLGLHFRYLLCYIISSRLYVSMYAMQVVFLCCAATIEFGISACSFPQLHLLSPFKNVMIVSLLCSFSHDLFCRMSSLASTMTLTWAQTLWLRKISKRSTPRRVRSARKSIRFSAWWSVKKMPSSCSAQILLRRVVRVLYFETC